MQLDLSLGTGLGVHGVGGQLHLSQDRLRRWHQRGDRGLDNGTINNDNTGNGCSPFCTLEPTCPSAGGACTAVCGDGIVEPGEACDDGNTTNGDGCSSTCQVEPGWTCAVPPLGKSMQVPVVYRDFNNHDAVRNGHPDFNPGATGLTAATTGLVANKLDSLGKPVYAGVGGATQAAGFITSATTYAQWYRDDPSGKGLINRTIPGYITLWDNGNGGYVNRWGPNGEQWMSTAYANTVWCSSTSGNASDCAACPALAGGTCLSPCAPWGAASVQTCIANVTVTPYDGNPVFFPIDPVNYTATGTNVTAGGYTLMNPVSPYELRPSRRRMAAIGTTSPAV